MPQKHLEFGGSTASRTYACPGWHVFRRLLPTPPSSESANVGTALHTCSDDLIMDRVDMSGLLGKTVDGIFINEKLIETKLDPAMRAFADLCDRYDIDEFEGEVPVRWADDVGGTADMIGLSKDKKTAVILDWKFGDGVMVSPVENMQAMHYAVGAGRTPGWADDLHDATRIVLAIIQPSTHSDEATLKVWETDWLALHAFGVEYIESVEHARAAIEDWSKDGTLPEEDMLGVGSHCRFCPAQAICPLKTGLFEQSKRLNLEVANDLGRALTLATEMEEYIRSVRKLAHEQMDRGDKIPAWKLVAKRATRQWVNAEVVETLVHKMRKIKTAEAYKHTLLTPAAMQALCKSKDVDFKKFDNYIHSVSSGTTIAPEADKRPAAPAVAALQALAARVS